MIVAVVGSRGIIISDLEKFLPPQTTEIVSGGAKGVDSCAKTYAQTHNIKYTEFLPDYRRFGRGAPLKRNLQIIKYADVVIAFWDGNSHGTKQVIDSCKKANKPIQIYLNAEI